MCVLVVSLLPLFQWLYVCVSGIVIASVSMTFYVMCVIGIVIASVSMTLWLQRIKKLKKNHKSIKVVLRFVDICWIAGHHC